VKPVPFYWHVTCQKVRGGKKPLWQAVKACIGFTGAGNTADNAIKDLQRQIRENRRRVEKEIPFQDLSS
jgi:hypothetical protein